MSLHDVIVSPQDVLVSSRGRAAGLLYLSDLHGSVFYLGCWQGDGSVLSSYRSSAAWRIICPHDVCSFEAAGVEIFIALWQ